MKLDIGAIAQKIISAPKPVVLVDTCSLLDIVRIPTREDDKAEQIIKGAQEVLGHVQNGGIYLAIADTVHYEFNDNLQGVISESEDKASKRERQAKHYVLASGLAGLPIACPGPFTPDVLLGVLSRLATAIVSAAIVIEPDNSCSGRAHARSVQGKAPASKGKPEAKDCNIIEHYLELARRLKCSSFEQKVVFVSANSVDFGKVGSLRPPLDDEFLSAGLGYGNNFQWALRQFK